MTKFAPTLSLLLAALAPTCALAAALSAAQVVSFTGRIQVTVNGKAAVIDAGKSETASAIPSGAEISVLSGEAVIQIGNASLSVREGDGFSFISNRNGRVIITGASGEPMMTSGESTAFIGAGSVVAVSAPKDGAAKMSVISGNVTVSSFGQAQTLARGTVVKVPTVPSDLKDAPASSAPPVFGQGEGFRSSFGGGRFGAPNPAQEYRSTKSKSHP